MRPWDYDLNPAPGPSYRVRPVRPSLALQHRQVVAPYAVDREHRRPPPSAGTGGFFNLDGTWRKNDPSWRSAPIGPAPPPMAQVHDYWTPRALTQPQPRHLPQQQLWKDFSAPTKPAEITFLQKKSAKECTVRFQMPKIHYREIADRKFTIHEGGESGRLLESTHLNPQDIEWTFKTIPGETYYITLTVKNEQGRVTAFGSCQIRATFNLHEMKELYERAVSFCSRTRNSMHPFRVLYRCKPDIYWEDIKVRSRCIMHKYIKDENGQAANPINGNIYGLFFSARLMPDGSLPPTSPFGNVRMCIPANFLLDPDRVDLYFCDFYCNKSTHYITVVICAKGTDIDRFCRERLLPLPVMNPFLRIEKTRNGCEFFVNRLVWVEIYYTDNVPLAWGRFDNIRTTGIGTSKIGGLPHNKYCLDCNLYPLKRGKDTPQPEPSRDEDDSDERARQHLNAMVRKIDHFGLPREDCEDVVFLLSNLVDQVAYETDLCIKVKEKGSIFNRKPEPVDDAFSMLNALDRKANPSTGKVRSKIRALNTDLIEKYERIHNAIMEKRNILVRHFTQHRKE